MEIVKKYGNPLIQSVEDERRKNKETAKEATELVRNNVRKTK